MDASNNPVIDQLIPIYKDPNFDSIFLKLTADETNNSRFLIKMELNRRYAPCVRIMDFRKQSTNTNPIEIKGILHYLSPEDVEVLVNEMKIYHGEYTMGVYEKVLEMRKQRKKDPNSGEDNSSIEEQISKYDVDTVNFASYFYRSEERMNYSSPAILYLDDSDIGIPVKTSDLSCGGIKLSIENDIEFTKRQPCTVTFTGLQKLVNDPKGKLERSPYVILTKEEKNNKKWLVVIKSEKDPEFNTIMDDFIQSNKLKYSVSVDNLLTTIETKGYEQYFLPRTTTLPLFFSNDEVPQLLYCLKSENNQGILEYWRDERNVDKISSLVTTKRILQLLKKGNFAETFIYTFRHMVRSHIYFFSATLEELEETKLRDLFYTVGSKRQSWKVYKFSIEKADITEQNVDKYIPKESTPIEKEIAHRELQKIGYVGQIIEIKNDEIGLDDYTSIKLEQYNANELQIFAHNLAVTPCKIEMLHYIKMRKEPRYVHKTAIAVKLPSGKTLVGWTKDISTLGMQIEVAEAAECQKDDILLITLPKMQNLTNSLKLKDLLYKVVHKNQSSTIIHLMIEGDPKTHVGRKFFNMLIESNPDALPASKEIQKLSIVSKCLRYLYTLHIFSTPLYLSKNKSNRLGAIGKINQPRPIYNLLTTLNSDNSNKFNVYPLFHDKMLRKLLLEPLRQTQRTFSPTEMLVYTSKTFTADGNICYETFLDSEFKNFNEKKNFVVQCLKRKSFYAIKMYLTKTGKPDIDYISQELDYISKYAIHKARRFEETIWSVIGICDIVDVTEEILFLMGLPLDPNYRIN